MEDRENGQRTGRRKVKKEMNNGQTEEGKEENGRMEKQGGGIP